MTLQPTPQVQGVPEPQSTELARIPTEPPVSAPPPAGQPIETDPFQALRSEVDAQLSALDEQIKAATSRRDVVSTTQSPVSRKDSPTWAAWVSQLALSSMSSDNEFNNIMADAAGVDVRKFRDEFREGAVSEAAALAGADIEVQQQAQIQLANEMVFRRKVNDVEGEAERFYWRGSVLNIVPAMVQQGMVTEVSDILELVSPPSGLNDEDTRFAAAVLRIAEQTSPLIRPPEMSPDDRLALIESVDRNRGVSTYGLFRANASNITKVLAELRTPELPVGMTTEEFNANLAAASFSQDDIDAFNDQRIQIDEFLVAHSELQGRRSVLRSEFAHIELADLERLINEQKFSVMFSDPGLFLFLPAGEWRKYVVRPLATSLVVGSSLVGRATIPLSGGEPLFGRHRNHQSEETWNEFEQNFIRAKLGGKNTWMAMGQAFEEWDTNAFNKFIVEVAADPTTYVGFGLYAKILKPIPYLRGMALAEEAWIRGTDAAFRGLARGITNISGRTLNAAIGSTVRGTTRQYLAAIEGMVGGAKIPFRRMASSEVARRTRALVAHARANPLDTGLGASVGRMFLAHAPLGASEVRVFFNAIGRQVDPGLIGTLGQDSLIARMDTLMTRWIINSGGRAFGTKEAATQMVRMMGEEVTETALEGAIKFIDDARRAVDEQVERLIDAASSKNALANITKHTEELVRTARTSEAALARNRWLGGTIMVTKAGAIANFLGATRLNAITKGFAKTYLMFSFYAPLNVLENVIKTAFRQLNPIPGFGRGFAHLVPFQGSSEQLSRLAGKIDFGDPVNLLADRTVGLIHQSDVFRQSAGIVLDLGPIARAVRPQVERTPGMSANTFRRLQKRTRKDWIDYLKRVPDEIFIQTGARIGLKQQANYILQGFEKEFIHRNPGASLRMRSVADGHANILFLSGLNREHAGWVVDEAVRRGLNDPQSIRLLADDFTPVVIDVQEIGKITNRADTLSPTVREFINAESEAGRLIPNIQRTMEHAVEAVYDEVLASPELVRTQLLGLIQEAIAKPINTADDLRHLTLMLQEMDEVFGSSIDSTLQVARHQYQRFTNASHKGVAYQELWDNVLTPYMQDAEREITRFGVHLRRQVIDRSDELGLTTDQIARLTEIYDNSLEHVGLLAKTRARQHEVEDRLLAIKPTGDDASESVGAWWQRFYSERDAVWKEARQGLLDTKNRVASAQIAVEANPPELVNVAGQKFLTPTDIGNLYGVIPQQITETMFRSEFALLRSKDDWVSMIMRRIEGLADAQGTTVESMGYSVSRIGHVYDTMAKQLRGTTPVDNLAKPQLDQLKNIESEVRRYAQRRGGLFPEEGQQAIKDYTDAVIADLTQREAGVISGVKLTDPRGLDRARQEALDKAWEQFSLDFPVYDVSTAFNETAKTIFPFWSYEAHRPFWLARTALQKPGVYTGVDKYKDYSDDGYVNVPFFGDVQVNFLRGTIFMGGFRRLTQRDFPDYYDQYPGFSTVVDQASRYGYYPNIAISSIQTVLGSKATGRSQVGELLPPLATSALDALVLAGEAIPGNQVAQIAKRLREILLPNRFRDYIVHQQIAKEGGPGGVILNKINSNTPLTEEEINWWDQGQIATSRFNLPNTHTGLLRMRPDERVQYEQAKKELYQQHYGIPIEMQEEARKFGVKLSDFIPMGPEDTELFRELEGAEQWRGIASGLGESEFAQVKAHTDAFNQEVRTFRDQTVIEKTSMEERVLLPEGDPDHISIDTWLTLIREQNSNAFKFRDDLSKSAKYSAALTTFDERIAYALERGEAPLILHPTSELISMFFDIQPVFGFNPDTGNTEMLWEDFFKQRRLLRDNVPNRMKGEVFDVIDKWDTPLESQRESDFRLMRPYFDARDFVRGTLSQEEQEIVAKYNATDNPDTRVTLQAQLDDQGLSIVSNYQGLLSTFRQNLRELQPEVDARLVLWNGLTARTDAALEITRQLRQQYGLR